MGVLWIDPFRLDFGRPGFSLVVFALLVAVIVNSVAAGNILGRVWPVKNVMEAEYARWKRIMTLATVLTVSFIPLFVLIDFFPGILLSLCSLTAPLAFRNLAQSKRSVDSGMVVESMALRGLLESSRTTR